MLTIESGLTTSFPRPEELVDASRDFDRGRKSARDLALLYEKWSKEVISLEGKAQFSWTTGGQLTSQDLFRPLVEASEGIAAGPLTRWYETNTFFRQPVVEGLPKSRPGRLSAWFSQSQHSNTAILPGPWTMSRRAENRTSLGEFEFAKAIAGLLGESISELTAAGAQRFILHEPELVVSPPEDEERKMVTRLYQPVASALGKSPNLVWTYFADAIPALDLLNALPVGGIGVDLSETRPESIKSWDVKKVLGLGCLDARTSLPEDPKEIASLGTSLGKRLNPTGIALGPGVPLDLLPWESALHKVEVLPQAVALLRGKK